MSPLKHYRVVIQYLPSGTWLVELQEHIDARSWRHVDQYATDDFDQAHTVALDWMLRIKDAS